MKIWESTPNRYDNRNRLLSSKYLNDAYDRLVSCVEKGDWILDVGCGTGQLSLRAAKIGAQVKGIDINRGMLDVARRRAEEMHFQGTVEFLEKGVAELDSERGESYDAVMSGLCFSELSQDELVFCLTEIFRILKPGGLLLVADEVRPQTLHKRLWNGVLRFFLKVVVFLRTGTVTRALSLFPEMLQKLDFKVVSVRLNTRENFIELMAKKP